MGSSPTGRGAKPQGGEDNQQESAATGRVKLSVYKSYIRSMGYRFFWGFLFFAVASITLSVVNSFWLSSWSDDNLALANSTSRPAPASQPLSLGWRLGVYVLLGLVGLVIYCLSSMCFLVGGVRASIRLHRPLLNNMLRARVSFYDITPLGRVLVRFGKELDTVDTRLNITLRFLVGGFLMLAQMLVVIVIATPLFALLVPGIVLVYALILRHVIPTTRQLQRLNSLARSPLYTRLLETVQGVGSIRAYGVQERFFREFKNKVGYF